MIYDFCIIGGGILGLATARELTIQRPGASIVLLEKETALGQHQTGHNSGVIHAGVYYKPGSLKATLCKAGAIATKQFCETHAIAYDTRGKLIVATDAAELARMESLLGNAQLNGIQVERLDAAELAAREPHITGVAALFIPETGIVDYRQICDAMGADIRSAGGRIVMGANVTAISETDTDVAITAGGLRYVARRLIACAGLQSDRLARLAGLDIDHQIVPFRGEYYDIRPERRNIVHHLIYPVPDPDLPFLGIHLTPMIDGGLTVGPNAVIGFAREGYPKFSFDLRDMLDFAGFPGFWRVARNNWHSAMSEFSNSLFKANYLKACQKYCPTLTLDDLVERPAGIRAQAVMRDGSLAQDFLFTESARSLHVGNAPSPAATSAIPIARMIAGKVIEAGA